MSGNSEEHSVLSMSDADFLNAPMPTFESASSIEQQEEEQPEEVEVEEAQEEAQDAQNQFQRMSLPILLGMT